MKRSIVITPRPLSGALEAMPSKSAAHRAAICRALAGAEPRAGLSDDLSATTAGLSALSRTGERVIDCGESGTTLRLLLPLALDGQRTRFTGKKRLFERPLLPYIEIFRAQGIDHELGEDSITVCGTLKSGVFSLPGDISSQFVSGLLFALPRLVGDSVIKISSPLQSEPYVGMTLSALSECGVSVESDGRSYRVPGGQSYRLAEVTVEGDFSHAAFWIVAGVLSNGLRLRGLSRRSSQGDAAVIDIVRKMGGNVLWEGDELVANRSSLVGTNMDISQTPDLFPILTVAAAAAAGRTVISGCARLRYKESDRVAAMAEGLARLGVRSDFTGSEFSLEGGARMSGGSLSSYGDHRIAMSLAVAASLCSEEVRIDDADCVRKSAPLFWDEYSACGGKLLFEGAER